MPSREYYLRYKSEDPLYLIKQRIINKQWAQKNKEYLRKYYINWYKIYGRNRAVDYTEAIKERKQKYPEKVKAHKQLNRAVQIGEVMKPLHCGSCNRKSNLFGHHPDYTKPLEVTWLCGSCHK